MSKAQIPPCPPWRGHESDYVCWLLEHAPHIYGEFERLMQQYQQRHPGRRISPDMVLHAARYRIATGAAGDDFKVNNNALSLFARLYRRHHPDVNIELRAAWCTHLSVAEWLRIEAALERGRLTLEPAAA